VLGGPAPSALASESVAVQGDEIEVDGSVVGPKADVPEGSGVVFRDQRVVVTQPEPGEFKAFTAVCTHQGCLVDSVEPA
jgi:Rieske Fe-S protein